MTGKADSGHLSWTWARKGCMTNIKTQLSLTKLFPAYVPSL